MKSSFFYDGHALETANKIKDILNAVPDFLSPATVGSPRAVGDAVERLVADKFGDLLGNWCKTYCPSFARRAMADLAFDDKEGFYCIVDVKTHRQNASFSMPALTSVERLSRFYEDDNNIFAIMMIKYEILDNNITVSEVIFCPIEFIDWDCLTIGALGWGQIQITNSSHITLRHGYSRKQWMLSFCERILEFYPKEIMKIKDRIIRFEEVKLQWQGKNDIWK